MLDDLGIQYSSVEGKVLLPELKIELYVMEASPVQLECGTKVVECSALLAPKDWAKFKKHLGNNKLWACFLFGA